MLPHRKVAATACLGLMLLPIFAVAQSHTFAQAHAEPAGHKMQLIQADSAGSDKKTVRVGDTVSMEQIDIVEQPEIYGLGLSPADNRFAIIDNQLVRLDPETGKVLSILRQIN